MRRRRNALVIAACLYLAGCGAGVVELELITPADRVDQPIARELAGAFESADGIRISLVPSPDGISAVDALESGYGDLAFVANIEPYRRDIAALLPIYSTVLHIIVRDELAGGEYAEVFEGARIFAGAEGSASRRVVQRFLAGLDIPAGSVRFVADPRAEEPDIIVLYAPVQPEEAPALPGYTMISLGAPEHVGRGSQVDRAVLLNPGLRPFVIPMATYGELNPDPVVTVAVDELLVARTDLDDAAAYDLTREFFRLRPALAGSRPAIFAGLREDFDPAGFRFALHPGARDYLERDAPGWLERYSGIGEVLVTLLVALVSGSVAAVNIYRFRRKNRIDVYYTRIFEILDALPESAGPARRTDAIDELRALKRQAFEQLVDEKLAANESFRIFATLADESIRELEAGNVPAGDRMREASTVSPSA